MLADGKVRHVGDPIAVVIADTKQQARDAAELLAIDLEDLPSVATVTAATAPGAPQVHDGVAGNICYDWHHRRQGRAATPRSPAAAKVVKLELENNRLVPNAMEPRAALGDYDPSTGDYTLYTTSQNPHVIRLLMGAFVLGLPEHKLRVVAPDVGGGFGSKIYHYAEEAIVTWAAGKLHKPVKWTADRSESFMSDAHGRDHVSTAELALDAHGKFLGLRVHTLANMGAYLSTFAHGRSDLPVRDAARGRLHDAGDLRRSEGRVHQHRAGGRLSRRRPSGGDVPARTPGRCRGARHRHGSRRDPQAEFHSRAMRSRTRRRSRCNTTAATISRRSRRR